ncbi:unnamed protein product [Paramecium pentaurelia]|uniref:sphinganine-1-phosphate aldolase n=1 Tax=Paramecium pentaurelia TaxID=43138 RepID=A0A8S1VT02_9CILI|nr:unnamed protein product [Paramecium pentaurelia]
MYQTIDFLKQAYTSLKSSIKWQTQLDEFDIIFLGVLITLILHLILNRIRIPRRDYNQSYWTFIKSQVFLALINYCPGVQSFLEKKKEEALKSFSHSLDKYTTNKTFKIPENGMGYDKINERLKSWIDRDSKNYYSGKVSGSLYVHNDQQFIEDCQEFTKNFLYSNPMHADLWPASRQLEAEVIKMTGELFGQEKEAIGMLTTGGTESILLAILAYRNWAEAEKGITQPNIVIPETAHAAFYKAGEYFKIQVRTAKVNQKTFTVDLKDLKSHINSNTICIVGSLPNFPYGTQDPIEELAAIAKKKKIGFHVDACLGGFIVAFAKEKGMNYGNYDFTLDGVTSISCDQHKHGLAPKGVSTILFKTRQLRQYAFFSTATWSGGAYAVPTTQGSKTGVGAAGAWFTMLAIGRKRYIELSKSIINATIQLAKQINEIPELEVCGEPKINCVCFKSKGNINVYSIHQILTSKGWNLNTTQNPNGIHISVTQQNIQNLKVFVQEIKEAIKEIKTNPSKYKSGGDMGALYGTTQKIPDSKFAGNALKLYLDSVLKL